ncbi:hypothetical protein [Candidatus Mycobacterium methanotrophicum]|uniref:DUF899 domain-containing protein n=1 Tax=Candidatus Mycobacterium methanotrophicum TaxID=2943498 RepID=A0ABY4QSX1_9MYCO|nr:hypothetical protein [Candidatus Mycobacterium methanotrophicum]UQX13448.1 hypothetical protein M5I08_24900 [Candidatus Mycobacterium methanotrophicum]
MRLHQPGLVKHHGGPEVKSDEQPVAEKRLGELEARRRYETCCHIDQRSLDHPVTRLAAEYGWRLDSEYAGPGRCIYTGPNGQEIAAFLTFDGEAAAETAVYYALPFPPDAQWIDVNDLPLVDQMKHLRDYFANTPEVR